MHIKPVDDEPERVAAQRDEGVGLGRKHAGLLRLLAGVDLHEKPRTLVRARHFLGERAGELGPVDRLDHIEQRDRLAHLVRLERADEMKLDAGMTLSQGRPLGLCLLHPVLAEDALTRVDRLLDHFGRHGLAHRHQPYRLGIAIGGAGREHNLLLDQAQAPSNVGLGQSHERYLTGFDGCVT